MTCADELEAYVKVEVESVDDLIQVKDEAVMIPDILEARRLESALPPFPLTS